MIYEIEGRSFLDAQRLLPHTKKKKLGSGFGVKKIRVGRVTVTTQLFFCGLRY